MVDTDILKILPGTAENQIVELQESIKRLQTGQNKSAPECILKSFYLIFQVCFEEISGSGPIFQCGNGHLVCGTCKPKMATQICSDL